MKITRLVTSFLTLSLGLSVLLSPSVLAQQSAKPAQKATTLKVDLTTAAGIESYLNSTYGGKFILKTSLANIPFDFRVSINKSKFEQFDILINFDYDVKKIDQIIYDNETSIDTLDNARATNTKAQIKRFVQSFATDITSKLPKKKIKGQTDGSYYSYPNIKQGYSTYLRNMWVNYDFVDPTSIFADYYGNLANYDETRVSNFKWAPQK